MFKECKADSTAEKASVSINRNETEISIGDIIRVKTRVSRETGGCTLDMTFKVKELHGCINFGKCHRDCSGYFAVTSNKKRVGLPPIIPFCRLTEVSVISHDRRYRGQRVQVVQE